MAPLSPLIKRIAATAIITLSGSVALVARAQGPGGGGAPAPRPEIRAFSARGADWAWLVGRGEEVELHLGSASTSGTPGQSGAKGTGWTDVALDGGEVWLLQRSGQQGALLRAKREGGEPEVVAPSLEAPAALLAREDGLYWLETTPPGDPGLAFIPQLGARLRVKCRDRSGTIRTVAEWTASGASHSRSGDLLSGAEGRLYACVRSNVATEIYAVPLAGGAPVRVAGELGMQSATAEGGTLVWTAPSLEATPESGIRRLQRLRPDGTAEPVAEWLPSAGSLAPLEGRLFCTGLDALYRVPDHFDAPLFRHKIPFGPTASDGKHLVSISGDNPVICGTASD